MLNSPRSLLLTWRVSLVPTCTAVMAAPETTAPEASSTTPTTVPVATWADTGAEGTNVAKRRLAILDINTPLTAILAAGYHIKVILQSDSVIRIREAASRQRPTAGPVGRSR